MKDMKLISLSQTEGSCHSQIQGSEMKMGYRNESQPIQHNKKYNGNPSSQTHINQ